MTSSNTQYAELIDFLRETWPRLPNSPITDAQRARIHEAATALERLSSDREMMREALDDAIATMAAVRATSTSDEWPEAAKHFHDLCGATMLRGQAALSRANTGDAK